MTGDELIEAYREELRRVYGDEIARRSLVFRNKSWYYLSVAVRTKEGIKTDMFPKPIRRSEFEAELDKLRSIGGAF
jgi:hypothetical protein